MNYGRLLFLAMIMFIGQGVAFSQGIKTVTSTANDGDGSLRQTISEAVDGDVIVFSGAIQTITVDSSLNLGDKTLTIDGGGDVVLERSLTAVDSFRVVTINADSGKVVAIKNLTIQNGLTLNEDGGGLWADNNTYGKTILEGLVFTGNTGSGKGGGAYITGGTDSLLSTVIDCEFISNEVTGGDNGDGDGGGIWAEYTEIIGCTINGNAAGDDGGGAWVTDGVIIDNTVFTGNSCSGDAGGAMRIQDRSVVVKNSTFESNVSAGGGGAVMLARGTMINCEFYNNTSTEQGGAINGNQNECYFYDCVFEGNTAGTDAGAVWMDDGGLLKNSIVIGNTAVKNGGGVYLAGSKQPAKMVGCIVANNAADSIGGGVFVAEGNVINSTLVNNFAAENGGALAGDGAWLLANSIVFGNDAAGDDKNVQVVSNLATIAAMNSAIDANGYDAAGWTASNITTLDASPFVGGSNADSLMLPGGSALIDAGDTTGLPDLYPGGWDHVQVFDMDLNGVKRVINGDIDLGPYEKYVTLVVTNADDNGAGSLRQTILDAVDGDNVITFADGITTIKVDQALELGDKSLIIDGGEDVILDGAFSGDPLLDIYRVFNVTGVMDKTVTIKNLTVQNGVASSGGDGGGLLADHSAGGQTMLDNLVFKDNKAEDMGGAVAITGYNADTISMVTNSEFIENTAVDDGGALVAANTMFSGCTFTGNQTGDNGGAARADAVALFDNCIFTGNIAAGAGGAIRLSDESAAASNCVFEDNSAGESAGAVFMARGTLMNCDFMDNTAVGDGGAIFANQNESYMYDCVFTGNSAGASGGAVYVDDGGMLSNCVLTNNSAVLNGGGVFLEGNNDPALIVGCLVDNNTADAQGGGVYVQAGDVINSIITDNYAGTNGGAFTGETGPWFMANSVVWNNDAAGAEKNIEVVSNSATDHAANCAIDATAYNAGAWTATNISTLDASPFVGGTGNDSLYSASVKLVDAGTLDYGILDILPETDLEGNARIQTSIDLGVYEGEIINVLGISLDLSSVEVGIGATVTVNATVTPDFATDKSVEWTSSDETVATVDGGVITGVGEGNATITATTVDGGFTATTQVTVLNAVTGVTLNETAISLEEGENFTLEATVAPADATNPAVLWTSGDDDVATVDGGVVTAVAPGTATITVVTVDGGLTASCEVTVTPATVAVTGVSLDQSTLELEPGGTATLVATVAPENATDKSVSWSSSDDAVATVADGVVTAVADGTCTITVTTTDGGFTATCDVTVETVGLEKFEAGFRMYPNPIKDKLYIEGEHIHSVKVYSITGTAVMIVEEGLSDGISFDGIESGMYILKIATDNGTAATTIVKE